MRVPLLINTPRQVSEYSDAKDPPASEAPTAGVMVRAGRPDFASGAGVYIEDPWVVCFEPTLVPAFLTPREALAASSVSHGFQAGLAARAGEMDEIRLGLHSSQVPPGFSSVRDLMERDPMLYFSVLPPWNVYCYGAQELAERLNIGDVLDVRRTAAHQDALGLPHSMPLFTDRQAQRRAGIEAAQHRSDWPQLKERIDAGQLGYVAKCRGSEFYALHFKSGDVVLASHGTAELPDVGKTLQLLISDWAFVTLNTDGGVRVLTEDVSLRVKARGVPTGILQAARQDEFQDLQILVRLRTGRFYVCSTDRDADGRDPFVAIPCGVDVADAQFMKFNAVLCLTDGSVAMLDGRYRLRRMNETSGHFFHCLLGSTGGNWGDAIGIDRRDGTVTSMLELQLSAHAHPAAAAVRRSKPLAGLRWIQTAGEGWRTVRLGFADSGAQRFTFPLDGPRKLDSTKRRQRLGTLGAQPGPGRLARAATSTFRWLSGQAAAASDAPPAATPVALQRARDMQETSSLAWMLYDRTSAVVESAEEHGSGTRQWVESCRAELAELRVLAGRLRAIVEENPDVLCLFPREMGGGDAAQRTGAPNADSAHWMLESAEAIVRRIADRLERDAQEDGPEDARAQPG